MNDELYIKPRFNEIDFMNVVHHGVYFSWFDLGREHFFEKRGITFQKLWENHRELNMDTSVILPITDATCKYMGPVTRKDIVCLKTTLVRMSTYKMDFHHDVLVNRNRSLTAKGKTTVVLLNARTRHPIPISKDIKQMITAPISVDSSLDEADQKNGKTAII